MHFDAIDLRFLHTSLPLSSVFKWTSLSTQSAPLHKHHWTKGLVSILCIAFCATCIFVVTFFFVFFCIFSLHVLELASPHPAYGRSRVPQHFFLEMVAMTR